MSLVKSIRVISLIFHQNKIWLHTKTNLALFGWDTFCFRSLFPGLFCSYHLLLFGRALPCICFYRFLSWLSIFLLYLLWRGRPSCICPLSVLTSPSRTLYSSGPVILANWNLISLDISRRIQDWMKRQNMTQTGNRKLPRLFFLHHE